MRLGQVHGAGPFAGDHLRQIGALELVAALRLDGIDGAERQQRTQAEGEVGRIPDLAGGSGNDLRQVLSAPLLRRGERAPAAVGELLVGILPTVRRDDFAIHQPRAGAVAGHVQRVQHLGAEFARFLDHRADGVLVHAVEHAAADKLIETRRRLERLHDVVYWSLIGHEALVSFAASILDV